MKWELQSHKRYIFACISWRSGRKIVGRFHPLTVWPYFGKILPLLRNFIKYFSNCWGFIDYFANVLEFTYYLAMFGQFEKQLGKLSLSQMAKYGRNNLTIWSECLLTDPNTFPGWKYFSQFFYFFFPVIPSSPRFDANYNSLHFLLNCLGQIKSG